MEPGTPSSPVPAAASAVTGENPHRLPRTAIPSRYDLTLEPDLAARSFRGRVRILLDVRDPVDEIVCNAADLELTRASVTTADGTALAVTGTTLDATMERATFHLDGRLPAGPATLDVEFVGVLNDKLHGFYASTYKADDGTTKTLAATQFEATDARRAFPCWDEPDLKAVFSVTLVVEPGLLAVSNGPVEHEESAADGRRLVRFADTMVMSTYLVCVVVGELVATDPVDAGGVPVRIVSRPGTEHLGSFALEVADFALRWYSEYYAIPYPGEKLDLIALPDFASGAMENLGAVTFREQLLLVDPARASRAELERIADVVAHEIAHMWFGDLVTMKWWNGLWLNEAFATFMEIACVDAFRPDWERWTGFSLYRAVAQNVDALHSTRPIEFPVISPADANGMFDVLTYEKGASVLRMLEQYLGPQRFREGVQHYLRTHSYANAETTDLWDAIEEVTGEPVRKLMDSWIFQGGLPMVSVELDGATVALSQERFTYLQVGRDETVWDVPVLHRAVLRDGRVEEGRVMLDQRSTTAALSAPAERVIVNAGGHGFYRVRYSPRLLRSLTDAPHQLSAAERYCLIGDTWASVVAGTTAAGDFLDLVGGFSGERDPNVWSAIVSGLTALDALVDGDARDALRHRVRVLLGPAVTELGWERRPEDDPLRRQLRGSLLAALGTVGDDVAVQSRADELFQAYVADPGAVDPDVVPAALSIAAHLGGADRYEQVLSARRAATTPQADQRLLYALGAFTAPELVQRTLAATLTEDIRSQDAPYLLRIMFVHRENGRPTWEFVRDRWDTLLSRLPDNTIVRMLEGVTSLGLSAPAAAADVKAFFGPEGGHTVPQGEKQLEQHLERLEVNLAFGQRERERLRRILVG